MKKSDIVKGQDYAVSNRAEPLAHPWSVTRVRVIDNSTFARVGYRNVPRSYMDADLTFQACHRAWALTQAYPTHTSQVEREEAVRNLRIAQRNVECRYFEEDPMRAFRKVDKAPRFDVSGLLGRTVKNDGTLGQLVLVPRRHVKSTWAEFEAEVKALEARKAEAAARSERFREEQKAQRAVLLKLVEPAFAGTDVAPPYIAEYGAVVTLSYQQALVLFQKAARQA